MKLNFCNRAFSSGKFQLVEFMLSIGRVYIFNWSKGVDLKMYPRFAKLRIEETLSDTRVVLISGPRQSGKTTLATDITTDNIPYLTLDDATVLGSALDDPVGFIRGLDRVVIDEIQRAPDLIVGYQKLS